MTTKTAHNLNNAASFKFQKKNSNTDLPKKNNAQMETSRFSLQKINKPIEPPPPCSRPGAPKHKALANALHFDDPREAT